MQNKIASEKHLSQKDHLVEMIFLNKQNSYFNSIPQNRIPIKNFTYTNSSCKFFTAATGTFST